MRYHCNLLLQQTQQCWEVLPKLRKLSACTEERIAEVKQRIEQLRTDLVSTNRMNEPYEDTNNLNSYSWNVYHTLGYCVIDMKKKPRCGWSFNMS